MGGNYEEVNMENQKAIVTYMSTMPKETGKSVQPKMESTMIEKSAQTEKGSLVPKESKECAQTQEASPIACNPPHSFEQLEATPSSSDSPHITINSESMQVDNTNVTVDRIEDPFKDFCASIVGNIVDYSSSFDEV